MEKIPLYDIVNKLLFGFLFVLYLIIIFSYNFINFFQLKIFPEVILIGFWLSFMYFCGYFINRIGSVIIEYVCVKTKIFYWKNYEQYYEIANSSRVQILNREYANSRTFSALFLILMIIEICRGYYNYICFLVIFFVLFLVSARKYTKKITKIINKGVK